MSETYFYDPSKGHGLPHDPFKAIVAPRPIGWISTVSERGNVNLAPYSFFNAFVSNPPVVGFCSEGWKDSIRNVQRTREFVANLAAHSLADAVNLTSAPVGASIDEMALAGLTPAPCVMVSVPRVAQSPAALECRLLQIVQLHDLQGVALPNFLALGQVVGVHLDTRFLREGRFDTKAAEPIARGGYLGDYFTLGERFEMFRPSAEAALEHGRDAITLNRKVRSDG
jgi:flavin reductase (DIM6/NTAB) family NADH-FMN oxidoreductase RutF